MSADETPDNPSPPEGGAPKPALNEQAPAACALDAEYANPTKLVETPKASRPAQCREAAYCCAAGYIAAGGKPVNDCLGSRGDLPESSPHVRFTSESGQAHVLVRAK